MRVSEEERKSKTPGMLYADDLVLYGGRVFCCKVMVMIGKEQSMWEASVDGRKLEHILNLCRINRAQMQRNFP